MKTVLIAILSAALTSLVLASTASAKSFAVPVSSADQCSKRDLETLAVRQGVVQVARDNGASDSVARKAADESKRFMGSKPSMDSQGVTRTSSGCSANVMVDIDETALRVFLNESAFCRHPVALMTRVLPTESFPDAADLSDRFHRKLMAQFSARSFLLIDVSENNGYFEDVVRKDRSCVVTDGLECGEAREFSFVESVLDVIDSINTAIEFHDGDNIDATKYFPLMENGVVLFSEFTIDETRHGVDIRHKVDSRKIADRNVAWTIRPESLSGNFRQARPEDLINELSSAAAERLALEAAKQCSLH